MRFPVSLPLAFLLFIDPLTNGQSVLLNPTGSQTVTQPPGTTLTVTYATEGQNNTVLNADPQSGGDIGAKINAAVAICKGQGIVCNIVVQNGGTISTPPELPIGFSLSRSIRVFSAQTQPTSPPSPRPRSSP
jgi:hypothetical protein